MGVFTSVRSPSRRRRGAIERLARALAAALLGAVLLSPAAADERPAKKPATPTKAMAEEDRKAALRRADELDEKLRVLYGNGKYAEAAAVARQTLALRLKALGPEHVDVASDLNNLALMLSAQGKYAEALPYNERALAIYEKALGPDHPFIATTLNNLGLLHHEEGRYVEARRFHERALAMREKVLDPDDPDLAQSLHNLGQLLREEGSAEEARPLLERSLAICEQKLGAGHPLVATILGNLAGLHRDQGDATKAQALWRRALKIREAAQGPDHPHIANDLLHLAGLLCAQGAYAEARPLFERSLAIRRRTLGQEHPLVAYSLEGLAQLAADQGSHDEARSFYEQALAIVEKAHGADHPEVARLSHNLGSLHVYAGRLEDAAPLLARSLDTAERLVRRNIVGLPSSKRFALMRTVRTLLDGFLLGATRLGRGGQNEVIRFKGLVARSTAAERRLTRSHRPDAASRAEALRRVERRLAKLANAPPSFRDKVKKRAWQAAYAKAAKERADLTAALARDLAPFRQSLDRLDLGIPAVRAALTERAVLIDYLRTGDGYFAWLIPHAGNVVRADLGSPEEVEAAVAAFAEQAGDAEGDAWQKAGRSLRKVILSALEEHIGPKVTTLHICPDAAIASVPFAALPDAKGEVLGQRFTISCVSMAQDLVPWKDGPKPGQGTLLVGAVDYDAATGPADEASSRAQRPPERRGRRYHYLPGTRAEVAAIKARIGAAPTLLLGADATEGALRAASRGRRVLHLATHGFVRDDVLRGLTRRRGERRWLGADAERRLAAGHDPMNLAGLALAGANSRRGGGDDDGILTALEASHLDLDGVALVVLSACETALGKPESGEGVIGLVRAFQMAGAKQVVGSLWKVDDEATMALMAKFYELWGRHGAAEALAKAQAFVREQDRWRHPMYWAAWVVWGVPEEPVRKSRGSGSAK